MKPLVDLQGSAMVITGGSAGIGNAIVKLAQQLGARVAVIDLETATEADVSVRADVGSAAEVRSAIDEVVAQFGELHALVNNAGIAPPGAIDEITEPGWRRTMSVNLDGAFFCTQAALPYLRNEAGSAVVNMASIAGRSYSRTASVAYAAAKGGVIALTRQLSYELAQTGIRVNGVCPGLVDTSIMAHNVSTDRLAKLRDTVPLGRLSSPDEIAAVACFLLSQASSYMTGSIVDVNGGLS